MNFFGSLIEYLGNLFASALWAATVTIFVLIVLLLVEKFTKRSLLKYGKISLSIISVLFLILWIIGYTVILPYL